MATLPAKIAFDFRSAIIIISVLFGGYYRIALILKHGLTGWVMVIKVGFIGLGNVGGKLAGSLLRNGVDLTVR